MSSENLREVGDTAFDLRPDVDEAKTLAVTDDQPKENVAPPGAIRTLTMRGEPDSHFQIYDMRAHWQYIDEAHGIGWVPYVQGSVYEKGDPLCEEGYFDSSGNRNVSLGTRQPIVTGVEQHLPIRIVSVSEEELIYDLVILVTQEPTPHP